MKKIVLGVVAAGMLALSACNTPDNVAVNNTASYGGGAPTHQQQ